MFKPCRSVLQFNFAPVGLVIMPFITWFVNRWTLPTTASAQVNKLFFCHIRTSAGAPEELFTAQKCYKLSGYSPSLKLSCYPVTSLVTFLLGLDCRCDCFGFRCPCQNMHGLSARGGLSYELTMYNVWQVVANGNLQDLIFFHTRFHIHSQSAGMAAL